MNVGLIVFGVFLALFFFWLVGRVSILRGLLNQASAATADFAQKFARAEVERDALRTHCDELRVLLGQANARPAVNAISMTDEQVARIAQAVLTITQTPPPKFIQ